MVKDMKALIKDNRFDKYVNCIVYAAFFVHQLFFLLSISAIAKSIGEIRKGMHFVIIISFLVMCLTIIYYFLRGEFSIKEILVYIAIFIPLIISLYNYRVVMVISNLFYAAIFKNVDCKKSLKIVLYATILGFVLNFFIGIVTKYTGDATQTRYGMQRVRNGLGFYYAYLTSYYCLTIVIMFILAFDKFNILTYVALMIFNIVIFILCDTKAAFAYTMITLILHLLIVNFNFRVLYKLFKMAVLCSFPCAVFLAIVLPILYVKGNAFWDKFNNIVSGRLYLTQNAIAICGWKWFGQTVTIGKVGEYYADSAILTMLICNGLVVLIMSTIFMTFFSYMAVKINHKPLMIVLFVIAIRSIFDLGFMTMQLGPVIIMFYDVYNKYRSGINEKY